jgi:glyoxylase-like metal-dependent hydrolase (beta-lactamase superfamily II)/ferredoxin
MADPRAAIPQNVGGAFFVDRTCIDCDTCRQLAPAVFGETGTHAYVRAQPATPAALRAAARALIACPVGAIGTRTGAHETAAVARDFPLLVDGNVSLCGFNSRRSFGANSYFVRHPAGNWLIDSPRYAGPLVERLTALGGVRWIFLTHRDDVADARRYAEHFGSTRVIHRADASAQRDAELVIDGTEPVELAAGFLAVPTPGHTRGHTVLLHDERYLFTGDHLAWDRNSGRLTAHPDVCWDSWSEQLRSVAKLTAFTFEWILPGHGERVRLPAAEMRSALHQLAGTATA